MLEQVPAGTRLFLDSSIFVHHFTGASPECRALLERCERGSVRGLTSVMVLAELAHRLMMIEALSRGLVSAGGLARKLRERPDLVRQSHSYQEQVERVPLMGVDVVDVGLGTLVRSAELCRKHGLLTSAALVVASVRESGAAALASADAGFERVAELRLYRPADVA